MATSTYVYIQDTYVSDLRISTNYETTPPKRSTFVATDNDDNVNASSKRKNKPLEIMITFVRISQTPYRHMDSKDANHNSISLHRTLYHYTLNTTFKCNTWSLVTQTNTII